MTTELTKAAQQALEALKLCYDVVEYPANGTSRQDKAIAALERALTQRPAAQTEQATPEPLIVKGAMAGMVDAQVRDLWPTKGATPEPAGWTDADADAARLAMELECLLLDTKDTAAVSRWWKSANEALDLHRARLAAAQAKGAGQ